MGTCGCETFDDILKVIPIKDKYYVLVELYHGCDYCHTPASLNIMTYKRKELEDHFGLNEELDGFIEERFDDIYTQPIDIGKLLEKLQEK